MSSDNKPPKPTKMPKLKNLMVPGQAGSDILGRVTKALRGVNQGAQPPKPKPKKRE